MAIPGEVHDQLAARFAVLLPHLNERQRRLALAAEARLLGHGGVRAVARAAGVSETTVRRGVFDLEGGGEPFPGRRVRRPLIRLARERKRHWSWSWTMMQRCASLSRAISSGRALPRSERAAARRDFGSCASCGPRR